MVIFGPSFALVGAGFLTHDTASDRRGVLAGSMIGGWGWGSRCRTTRPDHGASARVHAGKGVCLLTTTFFLGQFASPLVAAFGLAGTFAAVGGALIALGGGLWALHVLRPEPAFAEA